MNYVEDYRDPTVYQRAFELQQRVFGLSQTFPRAEAYSLTDQVRRSSRSIGYIDAGTRQELEHLTHEIGRMLDVMIRDADRWCRTSTDH